MKPINLSDVQPEPMTAQDHFSQGRDLARRCGLNSPQALSLPKDTFTVHGGLMGYLSLAYQYHYGVVLRPDDIWFTVLSELTVIIAKQPKQYAKLFTTTPDKKQWIIVPTMDVTQIDVELVIDRLKDCIPARADLFLPAFTTTTPDSRLAMHIAFCDMVSPYYSYGTYLCGIPMIRLAGIEGDWIKLADHLKGLADLFDTGPVGQYLTRCRDCVVRLFNAVFDNDADHLRKMVKLEPCGSGSQYEMSGWILDLLVKNKKLQLEGLPPHIACMSYKNLDTGRTFKLFTGLTESVMDGICLIPRYGRYVAETMAVGLTNDAVNQRETMTLASTPVNATVTRIKRRAPYQ